MKSIVLVIIGLLLSLPSPAGDGMSLWFWVIDGMTTQTISVKEGFGSLVIPITILLPVFISYMYLWYRLQRNNKVRPSIQALGGVLIWYGVVAILYRLISLFSVSVINIIIFVILLLFELRRD